MKGLGGVLLGAVMACYETSGTSPVATVPPNRCPRTAPSNTRRGSRIPGPRGSYCLIPSRRSNLLETIKARLCGGRIVSVFARSFLYLRRVWVVQIP